MRDTGEKRKQKEKTQQKPGNPEIKRMAVCSTLVFMGISACAHRIVIQSVCTPPLRLLFLILLRNPLLLLFEPDYSHVPVLLGVLCIYFLVLMRYVHSESRSCGSLLAAAYCLILCAFRMYGVESDHSVRAQDIPQVLPGDTVYSLVVACTVVGSICWSRKHKQEKASGLLKYIVDREFAVSVCTLEAAMCAAHSVFVTRSFFPAEAIRGASVFSLFYFVHQVYIYNLKYFSRSIRSLSESNTRNSIYNSIVIEAYLESREKRDVSEEDRSILLRYILGLQSRLEEINRILPEIREKKRAEVKQKNTRKMPVFLLEPKRPADSRSQALYKPSMSSVTVYLLRSEFEGILEMLTRVISAARQTAGVFDNYQMSQISAIQRNILDGPRIVPG